MSMRPTAWLAALSLLCVAMGSACTPKRVLDGGDGTEEGDGDGDGDCGGVDGEAGDACVELPPDGVAVGMPCTTNHDCASGLCLAFHDHPADVDAVCGPIPTMCRTRFTGRVLDITTQQPAVGLEMRMVGAIAAATNPPNATTLAEPASWCGGGRFDTLSLDRIESPLGVVVLLEGGDYYLTATPVAAPVELNFYSTGADVHDAWAVPSQALEDWSAMLANDPDVEFYLPLGAEGGAVGIVRDHGGVPVAGASLVQGQGSGAEIRYLNEAGDGFTTDATGTSGLFVLVNSGLGESFGLEVEGNEVEGVAGTGSSANGSVSVMALELPE